MPDLSPIQLVIVLLWIPCPVGAYRPFLKGHYVLLGIGILVPAFWLAGFFWDARPGSRWATRVERQ